MHKFFKLPGEIPALVDDPVATRWDASKGGFTFTTPSAVRAEGESISEEEFNALSAKLEAEVTAKKIESSDEPT